MSEEGTSYLDKKTVFTVGQLSSIISEVMSSELFMGIKVRGEIISKSEKNGNVYLTLLDSDEPNGGQLKGKAVLKVIVFSWYDRYIKEEYKIGDEVVVSGDMSYYAPFGSLSLNAKSLYLYGEGMELIRLKRLKEKLEKEGLFDSSRKKPLPKSIRKIAIITSAAGAAYHDIMQTLSKKIPVSTVLFDAVVQGAEAPKSLMRALDKACASDCDIIIFGRGGGSKTDLACFNDEALVRKVASCNKCLISGIGHEIDTSLCDLAADIYAITPTQAADKALPNMEDVLMELDELENSLSRGIRLHLSNYELKLSRLGVLLDSYSPNEYINRKSLLIANKSARLNNAYSMYLTSKWDRLNKMELSLEKANPLNLVNSGLALVKAKGKSLVSVNDVKTGDELEVGLKDGVINAIVK